MVISALGLAAAPAGHAASLQAREIAVVQGEFPRAAVDGRRFVVWGPGGGPYTVHDTGTDERRTIVIDDPTCSVTDAAWAMAVLPCARVTRLVDLRVGASSRTIAKGGFNPGCCTYDEIGRHWLYGGGVDERVTFKPLFAVLNWRTGAGDQSTDPIYIDRDASAYTPWPRGRGHMVYDTETPYVLMDAGRGTGNRHELVVGRTSGPRVRRHVSDCRGGCARPALASRAVTWVERGFARIYDVTRRRRWTIRYPVADGDVLTALRATRTHVVLAVHRRVAGGARELRVFAAERER